MRHYYAHGFNDFVICAGYRSWEIKDYFLNYRVRQNHLIIDHREEINHDPQSVGSDLGQERWRVRVFDTGLNTMTGGRLARAFDLASNDPFEDFAVTYGDGLSDVDLGQQFEFHKKHGRVATVLGVKPVSRFGEMGIAPGGKVADFLEKPASKQALINGGFFFFSRKFRGYLSSESDCVLERKPLESVVKEGELFSFEHQGFWQCMDTLRDKHLLQELWEKGNAPWVRRLG
jgi:glucose-1-phosphate cytidylyltransferase